MTQEELQARVREVIQFTFDAGREFATKGHNIPPLSKQRGYELAIQLINQHVAEVIGEEDLDDIPQSYFSDSMNHQIKTENRLRAEQRKRAGL